MRGALVLFVAAMAAGAHAQVPSRPDPIAAIEGVYKHRFPGATITPGKAPMEADVAYDAEDIIEIARYDDSHVYVRVRLEFYNGHSCGISGVAGLEGDAFVYHDPEPSHDGGSQCTLKVSKVGDKLHLTDRDSPAGGSTCREYCGVRGSLGDYSIEMSSRRPIRYMDRLKSSRQYLKAIQDLQKSNLQRSDPGTTAEEVRRRHQE